MPFKDNIIYITNISISERSFAKAFWIARFVLMTRRSVCPVFCTGTSLVFAKLDRCGIIYELCLVCGNLDT